MKNKTAATLKILCSILMLTVLFAAPVYAQDISSSLVAHYKLDETSGTVVNDSAGSATGTMTNGLNGTDNVPGKVRTALDLDEAVGDVITTGAASLLDGETEASVCVWFKLETSDINQDFYLASDYDGTAGNDGWGLFIDDTEFFSTNQNTITFFARPDGAINRVVAPTGTVDGLLDKWTHLCGIYSGTSFMRLYLNGELLSEVSGAGPASITDEPTSTVTIGGFNSSGATFDGPMDDLRIYNRALTAMDVKELFQSTTGALRYKEATEGLEYFNSTEWIHAGLGSYQPNAVTFDGTNDFLSASSPLNNSKKLTVSFWLRTDSTADNTITDKDSSGEIRIRKASNSDLVIGINDISASSVVGVDSNGAVTMDDGNWHHVLFSVDTNVLNRAALYIDDVDVTNINSFTTGGIMSIGPGSLYIGQVQNGNLKLNGDLADLWIITDTYVDLSVEANRRKFISASGMPMYLGPDGSLPLGKQPNLFLSGDTADWHTNKGSGSGFTENGALETSDSVPKPASTNSGKVFGWDENDIGQLGDGTTTSPIAFASPVQTANVNTFIDVSIGEEHGCGVAASGTAYCWGYGFAYRLGNGTQNDYLEPFPVSNITDFAKITAGNADSCGITRDGTAYCWGFSDRGEMGSGVSGSVTVPTAITSSEKFIAIDMGENFACGVATTGTAYCWGQGTEGQLGNGASADSSVPVPVSNVTNFIDISVGTEHACGVTNDGSAWCWGDNQPFGSGSNLGDGTRNNSNIPVQVSNFADFIDIAVANDHSCAVRANGEIYCWGWGMNGNADATTDYLEPTDPVATISNFMSVDVASAHTACGITRDYDVYCWDRDDTAPTISPVGKAKKVDKDDRTSGAQTENQTLVLGIGFCSNPSQREGSVLYNTDFNVMQYCNGTDWIAMGPSGIATGSGCTNPTGAAGDLIYNQDYDYMQYCNSRDWIGLGLNTNESAAGLVSLVSHWKLDESSGQTAVDSVGSNDGTSTDATPNWQPSGGASNGALLIDSNESIDTDTWNVTGSGITLAGWVNMQSVPTQDPRIICKTSGVIDNQHDWCIFIDDANDEIELRLRTVNGFENNQTNGIAYFANYQNEWHHITVTYDNASATIAYYIDGIQVDTDTHGFGGAVITSSNVVALGNNPSAIGGRQWGGLLDELQVYESALTPAQVFNVYQQTSPFNLSDDLVAHWKLEDSSGATVVDELGNNNGTWNDNTDDTITTESVAGIDGDALDFEYDDRGYINIDTGAGTTDLDNLGPMTVCAWVNFESMPGAGGPIVDKRGGASYGNGGWNLGYDRAGGERFFFRTNLGDGALTNFNTVQLGQNQHVCGTWDGTDGSASVNVYLDGTLDNTSTFDNADNIDDAAYDIEICRDDASSTFCDGLVDDVRIYDRVLSNGEIKLIYEGTR